MGKRERPKIEQIPQCETARDQSACKDLEHIQQNLIIRSPGDLR